MNQPLIRILNLEYDYPDGTPALRGISLDIQDGESVAIVGANGAGKSTLLLHLNGILTGKAGSVEIAGTAVGPKSAAEIRKRVGLVFQDPDDQLFMPSVIDDVAFGPRNLGMAETEVDAVVREALTAVGAWELRERPPYRLSAGEKRAAALAAVLAMKPDVLVLDEPSVHLDPRARRRLVELLTRIGGTRVLVTHDLDLALELCDRAVVMKRGTVLADGPCDTLFTDAATLHDAHLETPLRLQSCPICGKAVACAGHRAFA